MSDGRLDPFVETLTCALSAAREDTVSGTPAPRTNVYIDGFNLFYGCLQNGPLRWLDLSAFCRASLPGDNIQRIRYFTALISPRVNHPHAVQNQQIYLRALRTCPNLTIDYGHFIRHQVRMTAVDPIGTHRSVLVWKTEEKGSDVNLATRMLCDAFDQDFDVAVVVSNDSDLEPPIRMIRDRFHLPVGVLNPQIGFPDQYSGIYPRPKNSFALMRAASFYRPVRPAALRSSAFPSQFTDAHGTVSRPRGW